ncbi:hypothetical protein PHSY_005998 [Pseudozyma hubeiensis SY62]|uniref:Uncharacterized protein n=1 Tax=Pseudozyma hubeiensis (strain SY62) TaxID=1305764 RepID=R9PAP0_PSEHS|nr:hypothetical protein PHSY_005998 [Pseudozyma hubeiensis SY62]GAC98404.1 hypothetical protein PHSY_005998 [Pseudozyma hubeiensis SY62]
MSDRYHGSAYRSRGGPYRDDRRYPPRHPRDEHEYADARAAYDARDSYASSYYPEPRGYPDRPHGRRVHKAIPPPRPWDYSRRPPPRTEQERIELEREREAWEAKEEERYQQRMEERERERQRDWERSGCGSGYGAGPGRDRERDAEMYERERARHPDLGPSRRDRSRSPGADPRYEQRAGWSRASIGSSEGRERELAGAPADRPDAPAGYPVRRGSPPPLSSSAAAAAVAPPTGPAAASAAPAWDADTVDVAAPSRYRPPSPHSTPRGPARDNSGFISTPPTGPKASRGGPPTHPSSAYRAREGSGSVGVYTPGSDRDREASSYMSPSNGRFARAGRDGGIPTGPYRGGHPAFGRGRRDTNPYDSHFHPAGPEDDFRGGYAGGHPGSSPHENSPYSPSTSVAPHHLAAPRLSRTSSSQTPITPTSAIPTGPSVSSALPSPSTLVPPAAPTTATNTTPHFSSASILTPDLDSELLALETQRSTFISNYLFGGKRTNLRSIRRDLRDAELDYSTADGRRLAAEKALEGAKETADAYSLEENRKEELQRVMAQQLQQQQQLNAVQPV